MNARKTIAFVSEPHKNKQFAKTIEAIMNVFAGKAIYPLLNAWKAQVFIMAYHILTVIVVS